MTFGWVNPVPESDFTLVVVCECALHLLRLPSRRIVNNHDRRTSGLRLHWWQASLE